MKPLLTAHCSLLTLTALAAVLQTACTVPAPIGQANPLDRAEFPELSGQYLIHTAPVTISTTPVAIPPPPFTRPAPITSPIPVCPVIYIVD